MISEQVISWLDVLNQFPIIISLLPIIVGGEVAIITLAFLSQQGLVKLSYVIIFGLLGAVLADLLWYGLTKLRIVQKFKEWKKVKKHYENVEKKLEKVSRGKDFMMLLIAKFVVGTRVVTILYLGLKKISLIRFTVYSIATNSIWLGCMIVLGVLAGKGFAVLGVFDKIQWIITGVVALIILWNLIEKFITKKVIESK